MQWCFLVRICGAPYRPKSKRWKRHYLCFAVRRIPVTIETVVSISRFGSRVSHGASFFNRAKQRLLFSYSRIALIRLLCIGEYLSPYQIRSWKRSINPARLLTLLRTHFRLPPRSTIWEMGISENHPFLAPPYLTDLNRVIPFLMGKKEGFAAILLKLRDSCFLPISSPSSLYREKQPKGGFRTFLCAQSINSLSGKAQAPYSPSIVQDLQYPRMRQNCLGLTITTNPLD